MNFLNLEGNWNNINLKNFQEVDINGNDRIDGIFGEFTPSILEQLYNNSEGRENIFREQWLFRDRGIIFMVFKIPESILHDKRTEIIEKIIEVYDEKNFYIEIWSHCYENKWEYFLICFNKNLGFHTMNDVDPFSENKNDGIEKICQKIEKIIEI